MNFSQFFNLEKLCFFILGSVSIVFVGYRSGFDILFIFLALLPFIYFSSKSIFFPEDFFAGRVGVREQVVLAATLLLVFVFVFANFKHGWVLPAHDPIAIPLLSKYVFGGELSLDAFSEGSSAYSYPPGYPILLAPLWSFLPAHDVYYVFKIINLLVVSLIPFVWAWMLRRLFFHDFPYVILVLVSYLAFFGLERTLGFALPFAGKNAVLLGILLAPVVCVGMIGCSLSKRIWLWAIPPFLGLVLLHYSMLHLVAAMIGGYMFSEMLMGRFSPKQIARLFFVGVSVFGLLVLFLSEALFDPRSAGFSWTPVDGAISLFQMLFSGRQAIVIFMDADFGLAGSPFRGALLIFLSIVSIVIGYYLKLDYFVRAVIFSVVSLSFSLVMAFGIVPSGLSLDFARWFFWAQQSAVFIVFIVGVFELMFRTSGLKRSMSFVVLISCLVYGAVTIREDFSVFKAVNKAQAVYRADLMAMTELIEQTVGESECSIISDSRAFPERLIVVQASKVWEYAESASNCVFVNGSWMQPGLEQGRLNDGFPARSVLEDSLQRGEVLFLGPEARLSSYVESIIDEGLCLSFRRLDNVGGVEVWLIDGTD